MAQAGLKIKPIIADSLGDQSRHEVINRLAGFDPRPNLR
jgi:hypothetical protein